MQRLLGGDGTAWAGVPPPASLRGTAQEPLQALCAVQVRSATQQQHITMQRSAVQHTAP